MFILNKVSKEYADKMLFENVDLTIFDGEKIGIVGKNGSGKSTLLNLLAGGIKADSGSISCNKTVAYVKQSFAEFGCEDISKMGSDYEIFKYASNLKLNQLQLCDNFQNLSGGEKAKLMISVALSKKCDVLLLDEPTNNLDLKSIEWLIKTINSFNGTVIIVSHDRYFLNQTVNKIIELENGKLTEFYGNYDNYECQKQEKLEYDKKVYDSKVKQNKKLEKQVAFLNNLTNKIERTTKRDGSADRRSKGYKNSVQMKVKKVARQAEAKKNRLEKLKQDLGEKPFSEREIFYRISASENFNRVIISLTNVTKKFGQKTIFENANFELLSGDKIAILGDNGSGKTTLIKMILGKEKFDGELKLSPKLKLAYLQQNDFVLSNNQEDTIFELANEFDGEYRTQFLTNLCNMGLSKQIFDKKVKWLSAGEKLKMKLNQLILSDFNLLILDEPTNNLDLANKIFLEKVLKNYQGNLIIVSHDKTLINNVCKKKYLINNHQLNLVS